uniref:Uncharacterized protein n=1 Tax=Panagrolaimus superbus TaxID=310955 RepID=A0A914XU93_9BILA
MSLNSECISKRWYCQRECRFQFFENSGTCRIPSPNEHCFGMQIRYNYTWNHGIKQFPRELELLKRFPKCWSSLGPLICSSIYRPCSKNQYIEAAMKEPGFIEMWEVFPAQMCKKAMNECSFVIENGLWPDFLRWPPDLADTKKALPLIDSCYLPCETPIAGFDWILEGFRRRNSIISGITGAVFLLITIYLMGFSKIYQTSLCVFCLAQSFLCITFYLTFWFISASKSIRSSILCVDGGQIRRHSNLATLDPCALEAILSTFALIATNFWLCTLLLLRIFRPKIRNDNYFIYGSRGNEMNARAALAIFAYLVLPITLFISTLFLWHDLPVDPISGICHVGAGSLRHSLILHGILGFFCFVIVFSSIYVAIQKYLQEHKLERSLSNDIENNQTDAETLLKDEKNNIKKRRTPTKANSNEDDERDSYTLEHGLGDALFSDYWLGKQKMKCTYVIY